jgi:penicillin-binding protein 1C
VISLPSILRWWKPRLTRRRVLLVAAFGILCAAIAFVASLHRGLQVRPPSRLILDRQNRYLGEFPSADGELGYWSLPDALPDKLVTATIAIEDRYFYTHSGVRIRSVLRATWQNLSSGHVVSGASTLAMQVARLQSPGERSLWRKAREAAEALLLVHDHGHDRVLRQYLTIAPYGNNVRGAARAARLYFGKPVEDLAWLEAAFLASLPQAPAHMNPYNADGFARARRRATRILHVLYERGLISDDELAQSLAGTLAVLPKPHRSPSALHALLAWGAHDRPPMSSATLDLGIQEETARLLDHNLARLAGTGAGNTAAMVVEIPNGNVLAYVGSRDYAAQDAHGAIDYVLTRRSPGSALKPFIYALALERGKYTAASELPDTPVELLTGPVRAWLPENFDRTFEGPLLLRTALANSRNIPALQVLGDVGLDGVLQLLERGGVQGISYEPGRYGLALAIGALPVTLEELVGLYGALANGGESLSLHHFADEADVPPARLFSREATALVTDILSDPLARRPAFPAGGPLDFEYAVAVKTGTSQGNRDAWAVGYSDRLLVGVWVGNHDGRRMDNVTGASAAGVALHAIMETVMPQLSPHRPPATAFPLPENFAIASVCPLSGRRAGPHCPSYRQEVFIPGSEPVATCPFHTRVAIDKRNRLRAGTACPGQFVEKHVMLDLPEIYAAWARERHLELVPRRPSPLCGVPVSDDLVKITITEPRSLGRYLFDPDTPADSSALRFSARVEPPGEELVWEVDGVPVARTMYPYSIRHTLDPGHHTITARLARRSESSRPVMVDVVD